MPCFNPQLRRLVPGTFTINGKMGGYFISCHRGIPIDCGERLKYESAPDKSVYQRIPCNKCIGCKLSYAREWATRCMLEYQYHDSAYFATLTYADAHVPKSVYAEPDTGEAHTSLTLSRRDVQLFLKRLRKAFPADSIRYYGCAEYGPNTWRPHYHVILFGLHLDDLQVKRQNVDGTVTAWWSPKFQACWSLRPFGNFSPFLDAIGEVELSPVSWATCAYTARYVVKKQLCLDGEDFYAKFGLQRPFTFMSTKPAIGDRYFQDHPEIYDFDSISLPTSDGCKNVFLPRRFDKLYDIEHPDELAELKAMRRTVAEAAQTAKLSQTSLSLFDLLALEERKILRKQRKEFDI